MATPLVENDQREMAGGAPRTSAAAAATPLQIPQNFYSFHFPAMLIILFSFRVFISMNRSGVFYRWQGVWLLGVYVTYVVLQYALNIGSAH